MMMVYFIVVGGPFGIERFAFYSSPFLLSSPSFFLPSLFPPPFLPLYVFISVSAVGAAGPLLTMIGSLVVVFFWSFPQALMGAELSLMMNVNGIPRSLLLLPLFSALFSLSFC